MKLNTTEINKLLNKHNKGLRFPVSEEAFIYSCQRYIKAIKEKRMICSIGSVSSSGMSRTIKFMEMAKNSTLNEHCLLNFYQLFEVLGYTKIKHSDYFRIGGCGMDMVFATNYNIIHQLKHLGFMNEKTCKALAQSTPHVV